MPFFFFLFIKYKSRVRKRCCSVQMELSHRVVTAGSKWWKCRALRGLVLVIKTASTLVLSVLSVLRRPTFIVGCLPLMIYGVHMLSIIYLFTLVIYILLTIRESTKKHHKINKWVSESWGGLWASLNHIPAVLHGKHTISHKNIRPVEQGAHSAGVMWTSGISQTQVKRSKAFYKLLNCSLRHQENALPIPEWNANLWFGALLCCCVRSRDGPRGLNWKRGAVHSSCLKVSSSRRLRRAVPRGGRTESKGNKCTFTLHLTLLHSTPYRTLYMYTCVCVTRYREGMSVWSTGKRKQTSWHFCCGNNKLGWP